MQLRVDLRAQFFVFEREIEAAVHRVLSSGRYLLGNEAAALEKEFASYLGVPKVVTVADGTRALAMALQLAGVEPGDEVITTAFTAIPTAGAIIEVGAVPVFADIDPDTFLIDIDAVARVITPRTKAVMPVHIFGNVVDVPTLRRRLPSECVVIEDAAQAHGATLNGRKAGSYGDFATFSFYPTKNLGAYGDGGAIACSDEAQSVRLRRMRNHGMADKDVCLDHGVNSRLDEIQAAILRIKLARLDAMNAARSSLVQRYIVGLPKSIKPQLIAPNVTSCWHVFECRVAADRDRLIAVLEAAMIQSNIYYVIPIHLQPAFKHLGMGPGDLPMTEAVCGDAIALPLYPEMPESVVDRVIEAAWSWSKECGH